MAILIRDGALRYETADYFGAVEAFRRAYLKAQDIGDPQLRARASNAALFNMARAHVEAYLRDKNPNRLTQARDLLEKFIDAQGDQLGEELDADALLARIDVLETGDAARTEVGPHEPSTTERHPLPAEHSVVPVAEPAEPKRKRPGVAMMGVGGGLLAGSVVGFAVLGIGARRANAAEAAFVDAVDGPGREVADADGRDANSMVVTGAVLAVACVTTGALLVGLGAGKARRSRVGPTSSQRGLGFCVGLRF